MALKGIRQTCCSFNDLYFQNWLRPSVGGVTDETICPTQASPSFVVKIGKGFSIVTVHASTNCTEPKVSSLIFQNRKNMKASQVFFIRKISKGIPIVS